MKEEKQNDKPRKEEKEQKETPEIFAINKNGSSWELSRREFLGLSGIGGLTNTEKKDDKYASNSFQNKQVFKAHEKAVTCLAVSQDGQYLISGARDNKVKIWSFPQGALIKTIEEYSAIEDIVISPNGKSFIMMTDKLIKIRSLPNGEEIHSFGRKEFGSKDNIAYKVNSFSISPDNLLFATGSTHISGLPTGTINLWQLSDGSLNKTFKKIKSTSRNIMFSPKGELLITSNSNKIQLWNARTTEHIQDIPTDFKEEIKYLDTDAAGQKLVGGVEKKIKVWSIPDGSLLHTLLGHYQGTSDLAISPNGKMIAYCNDGNFKIYIHTCLLYTSPSPRDRTRSRMPSSA